MNTADVTWLAPAATVKCCQHSAERGFQLPRLTKPLFVRVAESGGNRSTLAASPSWLGMAFNEAVRYVPLPYPLCRRVGEKVQKFVNAGSYVTAVLHVQRGWRVGEQNKALRTRKTVEDRAARNSRTAMRQKDPECHGSFQWVGHSRFRAPRCLASQRLSRAILSTTREERCRTF